MHSFHLHFMQALRKSLIDQKRIINVVPEAPVFHPSVEEFKDVLKYIVSIKMAGEATGIVKIVPPPGLSTDYGQEHQAAAICCLSDSNFDCLQLTDLCKW